MVGTYNKVGSVIVVGNPPAADDAEARNRGISELDLRLGQHGGSRPLVQDVLGLRVLDRHAVELVPDPAKDRRFLCPTSQLRNQSIGVEGGRDELGIALRKNSWRFLLP